MPTTSLELSDELEVLLRTADAAYEQMCESGQGYAAVEVHRYIHVRVRGEPAGRPQPKPWRG